MNKIILIASVSVVTFFSIFTSQASISQKIDDCIAACNDCISSCRAVIELNDSTKDECVACRQACRNCKGACKTYKSDPSEINRSLLQDALSNCVDKCNKCWAVCRDFNDPIHNNCTESATACSLAASRLLSDL